MTYCERHSDSAGMHTGPAERDPDCPTCRTEARLSEMFTALEGREPSYRYFEHRGWRYCWTTERMPDGKFSAFSYRPVGPGSRSGTATMLQLHREVRFVKRSSAKARARKWWETAKRKAAA